MEDKLKRYEKIEFLGEGQVVIVLHILFKNICGKRVVSKPSFWRRNAICLRER